ncbi:MAG: hypothetical protein KGM96_08955 [Acidobacteriota bacterium]|nr:hypothetical protein [Acidobacteriota bacterium]
MATAPAVQNGRSAWHVRGTWSARDDRTAYAVWLGVLWVGMIAGFGVDFPRYLSENPPAPMIVHVHGAVFTVWMLILTAQVMLVMKDRVRWHMKMGWFAAGWACLMGILGPWAAMESQVAHLSNPVIFPQFISVHIVDIGGFLLLLAWGMTLRKNPAAHKRMMILATVSLADPGFSRFTGWVWPAEPTSMVVWFLWSFYGNVLLVALMLGWDWWRGRLIKQAVVGGVGLLAAEVASVLLYFWGPWKVVTLGWVQAWARTFG